MAVTGVSASPEYGTDAPWLENAVLKQRLRFLVLPVATGGSGFVIEYIYEPFAGKTVVPAHFHMTIEERFEILSGHLLGQLTQLHLPASYRIEAAGEIASRQESFGGLGTAILIATFGILAILGLEFRTFKGMLIVASSSR